MKTTKYNSDKRAYKSPHLNAIIVDSQISLQLQTHEKGTPPTEPDWANQQPNMYW